MSEDALLALDPECVYRMVALMCAVAVTPKDEGHGAAMAIADCFFEYIDPIHGASFSPDFLKREAK